MDQRAYLERPPYYTTASPPSHKSQLHNLRLYCLIKLEGLRRDLFWPPLSCFNSTQESPTAPTPPARILSAASSSSTFTFLCLCMFVISSSSSSTVVVFSSHSVNHNPSQADSRFPPKNLSSQEPKFFKVQQHLFYFMFQPPQNGKSHNIN